MLTKFMIMQTKELYTLGIPLYSLWHKKTVHYINDCQYIQFFVVRFLHSYHLDYIVSSFIFSFKKTFLSGLNWTAYLMHFSL